MGGSMSRSLGQCFFIGKPPLTEENLPDQSGKVFIITGSNTGVGYQVAKILYARNGTVYVAARTESKAQEAIKSITEAHPSSKGKISFLQLDLGDLSTIKKSADDFLSKETRLDWLNNNAGVMFPPKGSKGAQDLELTYQTNILGPYLFTKLLLPILTKTAGQPDADPRVSFAGSLAIEGAPKAGLIWTKDGDLDDFNCQEPTKAYGVSKTASYFFGQEFARRYGRDGILFTSYNPGNLRTDLQRHMPGHFGAVASKMLDLILYPSVFGAYTEIYGGLSKELKKETDQGVFISPWGRKNVVRPDVAAEIGEGGNAQKLFDWCEQQTKKYA